MRVGDNRLSMSFSSHASLISVASVLTVKALRAVNGLNVNVGLLGWLMSTAGSGFGSVGTAGTGGHNAPGAVKLCCRSPTRPSASDMVQREDLVVLLLLMTLDLKSSSSCSPCREARMLNILDTQLHLCCSSESFPLPSWSSSAGFSLEPGAPSAGHPAQPIVSCNLDFSVCASLATISSVAPPPAPCRVALLRRAVTQVFHAVGFEPFVLLPSGGCAPGPVPPLLSRRRLQKKKTLVPKMSTLIRQARIIGPTGSPCEFDDSKGDAFDRSAAWLLPRADDAVVAVDESERAGDVASSSGMRGSEALFWSEVGSVVAALVPVVDVSSVDRGRVGRDTTTTPLPPAGPVGRAGGGGGGDGVGCGPTPIVTPGLSGWVGNRVRSKSLHRI
ncbi:hypothetical protein PoMZ_10850 [Pyricularia oryzae]|uniref:Uncharacterized protein n=1 Tax=Pyricularia oryzae TaxID=318829 RepID=A0A4P7NJ32_PYROR|nr:hypothetical protein PoMZ_10850 [Pyricularia oryzae]